MRFMLIAGARPNFMKIAPILRELDQLENIETTLVHTGQHYDKNLSEVFFEELDIRKPDVFLNVGSGSHAEQTAAVMVSVEKELLTAKEIGKPVDQLIVVGDVNSTVAATLAASKLNIPVAHVEAGLRSRDRTMPEEINRLVTDSISSTLLCSEPAGVENLLSEGAARESVHLVGNVMIDTLKQQVENAKRNDLLNRIGLTSRNYAVVTLHRPANVDDPNILENLLRLLVRTAEALPILFPVHPRTKSKMEEFGLLNLVQDTRNFHLLGPLGYRDFLCLTSQARVIVTDSGGLQEESTALGVPCLTMRENTERPITCSEGSSTLIGNSSEKLSLYLGQVMDGQYKQGRCPELWDGNAAKRIAKILTRGPSVNQDDLE